MFPSEFTICDMAPEYAIKFLLWCSWFDIFAIDSSLYIRSSVMLLADYFFPFSSFWKYFLCDCSFCNNFISSCYFCSCFSLIFSPDSLPTVFLEMSRFFTVMKSWYLHTFFVTEVLSLVSVSPASCAGTLVLVFYVEGFLIFSWISWYWLFVRSVKIYQNIIMDTLNSLGVVLII